MNSLLIIGMLGIGAWLASVTSKEDSSRPFRQVENYTTSSSHPPDYFPEIQIVQEIEVPDEPTLTTDAEIRYDADGYPVKGQYVGNPGGKTIVLKRNDTDGGSNTTALMLIINPDGYVQELYMLMSDVTPTYNDFKERWNKTYGYLGSQVMLY